MANIELIEKKDIEQLNSKLEILLQEMKDLKAQKSQKPAETKEQLLNMTEAAKRLGISQETLRYEIENGIIPVSFRKLKDNGKSLFCRETELNNFIRTNFATDLKQ